MNDDLPSVDFFRQRFVEPMGEESDHVHIVALTDALQVCVHPGAAHLAHNAGLGGMPAWRLASQLLPASLSHVSHGPVQGDQGACQRPSQGSVRSQIIVVSLSKLVCIECIELQGFQKQQEPMLVCNWC